MGVKLEAARPPRQSWSGFVAGCGIQDEAMISPVLSALGKLRRLTEMIAIQ
ncbi:MAG: hypothetical protein ACLQIQ_15900 [Beijerinckiaceae bacterium]